MKFSVLPVFILIMFFSVSGLHSETEGAETADDSVSTTGSPVNAGTISAPEPVAGDTGKVKGGTKSPEPVSEKPEDRIQYLLIDEGFYKYARIEGITKKMLPPAGFPGESDAVNAAIQAPRTDEASETGAEAELIRQPDDGGFAGLSRDTTDIIARIALALLIVLIFVLYRMRSGTGNRKVRRKYRRK